MVEILEFIDKFEDIVSTGGFHAQCHGIVWRFPKAYGCIVETALREPVSIASHGRERLVLLSADEYRRLKENDRTALYPWELSDDDLRALEVSEPPAAASQYDDETTPDPR